MRWLTPCFTRDTIVSSVRGFGVSCLDSYTSLAASLQRSSKSAMVGHLRLMCGTVVSRVARTVICSRCFNCSNYTTAKFKNQGTVNVHRQDLCFLLLLEMILWDMEPYCKRFGQEA